MESKSLKVIKLRDNAIIPTKGTKYSAGYDLYANITEDEADTEDNGVVISPGETKFIHTGIAFQLPPYTFGGVYARSGLACKRGLRPGNAVGICDEDYTGEVLVALHNDSFTGQIIYHGERIAQYIVQPVVKTNIVEVEELDKTERGAGGFGHTGR